MGEIKKAHSKNELLIDFNQEQFVAFKNTAMFSNQLL